MRSLKFWISVCLWLMFVSVAGCAAPTPAVPSASATTNTTPRGAATAIPSTAVPDVQTTPVGVIVVTVMAATPISPFSGTPAAIPTATPVAAANFTPSPSSGIEAELKYSLLARYPSFFYCDPDFYPIAHGDEEQLALMRFPEIQRDNAKYQVILKHTGLSSVQNLSDAQKLIVYREYKKLNALLLEPAGSAYKFQLRVQDSNTASKLNGFFIEGTITPQAVISVTRNEPAILSCPICLAAHTLIDTPHGPLAIQDLREGMSVWTLDAHGARVPATIVRAAHVPVPLTHQMAHLRLDDGRELLASPGHPTADGRHVGDLRNGDRLDGAHVVGAELVTYAAGFTYDILPSGETGVYWANGILLGSTLK